MAMATYYAFELRTPASRSAIVLQASSNERSDRWISAITSGVERALHEQSAVAAALSKKILLSTKWRMRSLGKHFCSRLAKQVRSTAACLDCCCKEREHRAWIFLVWQLSVTETQMLRLDFAFVEHLILRKRIPQTVPQTYPKVVKMR